MIKRCKLTKRRYADLDEFLMKADAYSYIVASMVDEDVGMLLRKISLLP
jgi:hypothetical protein